MNFYVHPQMQNTSIWISMYLHIKKNIHEPTCIICNMELVLTVYSLKAISNRFFHVCVVCCGVVCCVVLVWCGECVWYMQLHDTIDTWYIWIYIFAVTYTLGETYFSEYLHRKSCQRNLNYGYFPNLGIRGLHGVMRIYSHRAPGVILNYSLGNPVALF